MKHAVILCNGEFPKKEYPLYLLETAGIIVCCDSAVNAGRLERLGLEPDVIVGDMDSTPSAVRKKYADRLVQVDEQDDNDLAKAFALLRERWPEVSEIHILGAGGKNEAHLVGNLGWLMEWERRSLAETGRGLAARGISVDMISDWSTAFATSPDTATLSDKKRIPEISGTLELHIGEGRKVSFFATDPELRLRSVGLVWPLDGVDLSKWWTCTLNRASADVISLEFNKTAPLLVILD